jgi:hypothetical protein
MIGRIREYFTARTTAIATAAGTGGALTAGTGGALAAACAHPCLEHFAVAAMIGVVGGVAAVFGQDSSD